MLYLRLLFAYSLSRQRGDLLGQILHFADRFHLRKNCMRLRYEETRMRNEFGRTHAGAGERIGFLTF
jgi:hypothetical protein